MTCLVEMMVETTKLQRVPFITLICITHTLIKSIADSKLCGLRGKRKRCWSLRFPAFLFLSLLGSYRSTLCFGARNVHEMILILELQPGTCRMDHVQCKGGLPLHRVLLKTLLTAVLQHSCITTSSNCSAFAPFNRAISNCWRRRCIAVFLRVSNPRVPNGEVCCISAPARERDDAMGKATLLQ